MQGNLTGVFHLPSFPPQPSSQATAKDEEAQEGLYYVHAP